MLKMIYNELYLGGAETLLLRVGSFCLKNGINVELYCDSIKSHKMKEMFIEEKIRVIENNNAIKSAFTNVSIDDVYLTLSLYDYINCLSQKNRRHLNNKLFYYVVHPYNPIHKTRLRLLNRITKNNYKRILDASIKEGMMFFMDEACVREYKKNYGRIPDNVLVIPLPMEITPLNEKEVDYRGEKRHDDFNILSVARADFPFKGYLKGLIKEFQKLYLVYSKSSLTIISSGEAIFTLKQWINDADPLCKNRIQLIENVQPTQLKEYYKKASLYIGMGTTLLEACNMGVPSLPIESYTYELKSNGYFDEVKGEVCVMPGEGESASEYIEEIMNFEDDKYKDLVLNCRKTYEKKYDINILFKYILGIKSNQSVRVPSIIVIENKTRRIIHKLNRIKRKILHNRKALL